MDIELFLTKYINNIELNINNNNYEIYNLDEEDIKIIKNYFKENPTSLVKFDPFISMKKEYQVENIVIDFSKTKARDLFREIARKLNLEYDGEISNLMSVFEFSLFLRNHNKTIQLHLFNMDKLQTESLKRVNTLFLLNTNTLTVKSYIQGENFPENYATFSGKFLDNREDLERIIITKKRLIK